MLIQLRPVRSIEFELMLQECGVRRHFATRMIERKRTGAPE
jgi:hypothetical protein